MSAKSLLRYRTAVGGDNLLSSGAGAGQEGAWPAQPAQPQQNRGKKSPVAGSGEAAATRLEEDSFDEGIDDILAQVTFLGPVVTPCIMQARSRTCVHILLIILIQYGYKL